MWESEIGHKGNWNFFAQWKRHCTFLQHRKARRSSLRLFASKETYILKNGRLTTYVHLFDSCTQDFHLRKLNLLLTLKAHNPFIHSVHLRSDEAGCYHNNLLLASIHDISKRVGIVVTSYDFSEPQHGKEKAFVTVSFVPWNHQWGNTVTRVMTFNPHRTGGKHFWRDLANWRCHRFCLWGEREPYDYRCDNNHVPPFSMYRTTLSFYGNESVFRKRTNLLNYNNLIRAPQRPTSMEINDNIFFKTDLK